MSKEAVMRAMQERLARAGSAAASAVQDTQRAAESAARYAGSVAGSAAREVRDRAFQLISPVSGIFARNSGNAYGASRSGGTREHSGIDWSAENGSSVYSMAGGTVLYTGTNQGYGANIVVRENDGTIRRYATHNSVIDARPGTTIRPGQVIGTIGENHLHYEEIPETINGKPNPVYAEMVASPGKFVSTSRQRGTVNPAITLGLQPGTVVQGASPVRAAGAPSSGDPQVAALQQQLNAKGANLVVDGIMGPRTQEAVNKYTTPVASRAEIANMQRDLNARGANLTVDGIIGPRTREAVIKYASAYAPTNTQVTPAQQAAAGQTYGFGGSTSYERGSQVAAMQRDLNSRGANLTVDGIRGPLTMAAEQRFLGSPTSVRTPSFTASPSAAGRIAGGFGAAQPVRQLDTPSDLIPYTDSNSKRIAESFDASRAVRQMDNPYTSSTGGANAIQAPRQVPTVAVQGSAGKLQLPSYTTTDISGPNVNQPGGRRVPTTAGYAPTTGPVLTGGFVRPMSPYTSSTGGANAIQAPRLPQPRPAYPLQAVPSPALMQQLEAQRLRDAAMAAQIARESTRSGGYSGGGYSGGGYSGGGYTGGTYGGSGGSQIASGTGGAFRNR